MKKSAGCLFTVLFVVLVIHFQSEAASATAAPNNNSSPQYSERACTIKKLSTQFLNHIQWPHLQYSSQALTQQSVINQGSSYLTSLLTILFLLFPLLLGLLQKQKDPSPTGETSSHLAS